MRSAYAQARDALQSDQASSSANRPAPRTLGSHLAAERNREIEALRTRLGRDENMLTLQRTHAERCQRNARRLQERLAQVDAKLQQARHSSRINTEELWQYEQTVSALEAANGDMQRVVEHAAAHPPADEALPVAADIVADTMEALLEALPGFREQTIDPVNRQVLRAWADGLHGRSAAFGSDALQPVDALRIALQALAIASDGDATAAASTLQRLGVVQLRELIPPPQVSIAAEAVPTMETVTACVGLLASVPRGMQVLSHMLREEPTPSREWLRRRRSTCVQATGLHSPRTQNRLNAPGWAMRKWERAMPCMETRRCRACSLQPMPSAAPFMRSATATKPPEQVHPMRASTHACKCLRNGR